MTTPELALLSLESPGLLQALLCHALSAWRTEILPTTPCLCAFGPDLCVWLHFWGQKLDLFPPKNTGLTMTLKLP